MSTLSFTIIQTELHWEDQPSNLLMLQQKIASINEKTEVVILPEMFTTGFTMQPEKFAETMQGETVAWMKNIAATKRIILTGSIIIEENNNYYNRLLWVLPSGDIGFYNKRHLFAYGHENAHYTGGNKRLIASAKGWKINLQVCYDLRFPVWCRQQQPQEYDVLVYVANWPQRRIHAWTTLLQARAIENQCYVIGINRTGMDGNGIYHSGGSMVINALGETLYHKQHEEDIFTIALSKDHLTETRNKFPFWKDADHFFINNE